LLVSALIFLYGLPSGSLIKNKKEIAVNVLAFLIIAIGLFLVIGL